jgi:hypothetical protein
MRGIPPLEDVTVLPVWAKLWWKRDDLVKDQGPGDDIGGRVADMAERKKRQEVEKMVDRRVQPVITTVSLCCLWRYWSRSQRTIL